MWLGLAVQLCALPWPGFVSNDLWSLPQVAVLRLAESRMSGTGLLAQLDRLCSMCPVAYSLV